MRTGAGRGTHLTSTGDRMAKAPGLTASGQQSAVNHGIFGHCVEAVGATLFASTVSGREISPSFGAKLKMSV